MRSSTVLSLLVAVLFGRNVGSLENNKVDVVIAFKVSDYENIDDYDQAIEEFFKIFTEKEDLFNEGKWHVSVVQYSNNVEVKLPLNKGTTADAIRGVKLNGGAGDPRKSEEVAGAVKKAAFGPNSGVRSFVPKIVIIVAISKVDKLSPAEGWSNKAKSEADLIESGNEADVVQIAHFLGGVVKLRCSSTPVDMPENIPPHAMDLVDGFKIMAKDALKRTEAALKKCSYDDKPKPCHFEANASCIANVTFVDDQYKKYCLRAVSCPGGVAECAKQCEEVSTWSGDKRVAKDDKPDTVVYHDQCVKFGGDSFKTRQEEGSSVPGWVAVPIIFFVLVIIGVVAVFVYWRFYKRRPDTKKRVDKYASKLEANERNRDTRGGRGRTQSPAGSNAMSKRNDTSVLKNPSMMRNQSRSQSPSMVKSAVGSAMTKSSPMSHRQSQADKSDKPVTGRMTSIGPKPK